MERTYATVRASKQRVRESSPTALRRPERSLAEWLTAASVFAVTCLAYLPFLRCDPFGADEGILLQGARRILHGQVLYRDFFAFCAPASYYALALLFRLFGDSVHTGRIALVVEGGLMAALTYLLARRVAARWACLTNAFFMAVACLPYDFVTLHNWDSTLLAYLALYAAVLWIEGPHWIRAAAVGFFAALTCLDEQSKGAGLVLGLAAAGFWLARQPEWRERLGRSQAWAAAAGFAAPVLATAGYFASHRALGSMLADLLWPLRHYTAANAVPYGYTPFRGHAPAASPWPARANAWVSFSPHLLVLILPWVGLGLAAFLWLGLRPGRPGGLVRAHYLLVSTVMAGLLLSVLGTRQDYSHVVFLTPIFVLVLAWLIGRPLAGQAARLAAPTLAAYVFLFGALLAAKYWTRAIWGFPKTMATAGGRLRVSEPDPVLAYLRRLPPGPILVYPYQPDYYYFSGRENPTRFEWLQAGLNDRQQFQEARREIEAAQPVAVLFDFGALSWESEAFPETPPAAFGADYGLATLLFRRYQHCATVQLPPSHWAILLPRGTPCPAPDRPRHGRLPAR